MKKWQFIRCPEFPTSRNIWTATSRLPVQPLQLYSAPVSHQMPTCQSTLGDLSPHTSTGLNSRSAVQCFNLRRATTNLLQCTCRPTVVKEPKIATILWQTLVEMCTCKNNDCRHYCTVNVPHTNKCDKLLPQLSNVYLPCRQTYWPIRSADSTDRPFSLTISVRTSSQGVCTHYYRRSRRCINSIKRNTVTEFTLLNALSTIALNTSHVHDCGHCSLITANHYYYCPHKSIILQKNQSEYMQSGSCSRETLTVTEFVLWQHPVTEHASSYVRLTTNTYYHKQHLLLYSHFYWMPELNT